MNKASRGHRLVWIAAAAVILLALFLWWQNNSLVVSRHTYTGPKVPEPFGGFRILHLSDLHNKTFGGGQRRLLALMAKQEPDCIVITGDLIDSRRYDLSAAMELVEGAVSLAPTYYVSGNHEMKSGHWQELCDALQATGVQVLEDTFVTLEREGAVIRIAGLSDNDRNGLGIEARLTPLTNADVLCLLLAHRPERISAYGRGGADVVFSGHAHGGQIRLPFIGGLYAPNQGTLPKHTSGEYRENGTVMYVSRGLGNSLFPFRIGNRPELLTVTLERGNGA